MLLENSITFLKCLWLWNINQSLIFLSFSVLDERKQCGTAAASGQKMHQRNQRDSRLMKKSIAFCCICFFLLLKMGLEI